MSIVNFVTILRKWNRIRGTYRAASHRVRIAPKMTAKSYLRIVNDDCTCPIWSWLQEQVLVCMAATVRLTTD